jgi:multiple sugar transport system substrate-binding protein
VTVNKENGEKVRLRFMNWDTSDKVTRYNLEKALKEFMDKNPRIEVVNISVPFYEYQEQLIRQTSDGSDPDIIQLTGYWPSLLGSRGVLEKLDERAEELGMPGFVSENSLDTCKYRGSLYSIPFSINPYGLWYNKYLLRSAGISGPPETIEELVMQLEKIKNALPDKYGIGIDTTMTEHALTTNLPFFLSFGCQGILSDSRNPGFDSESAVKAVEWFKTVINGRYTPDGVKTDILREKMAKGEIVFKVDGPELRGIIQGKSKNSDYKGKLFDRAFGVVPVPPSRGIERTAVMCTYSYGISARSKYKQEAWELIDFLVRNEDSARSYLLPSGYIPAYGSMLNRGAEELENPSAEEFMEKIAPVSKSINYNNKFSEASIIIIDGIKRAVDGMDAAAACGEIDRMLRELFNY